MCHVSNLSWNTTDDTLHELFSGYGEVVSAEVQMSRAGRSQGWGLVEFASAAEVEYAISQCDGLDLDSREIRVREDKGRVTVAKEAAVPAKTKRQRQTQRNLNNADKVVDPTRIFVMNLNFDTTEEDLADHCASSGEVASVELLTRGRAQRPSGSAVVEYRYAEAAAAWRRSRARSSTGATCACGRTSPTKYQSKVEFRGESDDRVRGLRRGYH